jgi:hypothetical protein
MRETPFTAVRARRAVGTAATASRVGGLAPRHPGAFLPNPIPETFRGGPAAGPRL